MYQEIIERRIKPVVYCNIKLTVLKVVYLIEALQHVISHYTVHCFTCLNPAFNS